MRISQTASAVVFAYLSLNESRDLIGPTGHDDGKWTSELDATLLGEHRYPLPGPINDCIIIV